MEPNYGILSIIPAIICIGLALYTKRTVLSLMIGSYIGVVILTGWNPLAAIPHFLVDYMYPTVVGSTGNFKTLLIIIIIQGFVRLLKITGAGEAMATWVKGFIKSKRSAEVLTCAAGFAFIYTEPCFILGAIMRPVTEAFNVAKVKLAYICDSLGCNMAALSPICSYGPYYTGLIATQIAALGLSLNEWSVYAKYIPTNFYSLVAIVLAWYVCATGKDVGKMYLAEKRASETGHLIGPKDDPIVKELPDEAADSNVTYRKRNFIIPMATMFIALIACLLYTGNVIENGTQVIRNWDITTSIIVGFIAASFAAIGVGVADKKFKVTEGFSEWIKAFQNAMEVLCIMVLAWTLSSVSGALGLKFFVAGIVEATGFPPAILPAIIFLFGAIISFATGSSWGTTALLMPLAVPVCYAYGIDIHISAAAAIAGGLFGDHCSPISDTTIKASMASMSDHPQHVATQLPYALSVGVAAFVAFIVSGLTNNNLIGLVVALVIAIGSIEVQHRMAKTKYAGYDFSTEEVNPLILEGAAK